MAEPVSIFVSLQLPCGMHHRWLTAGEAKRMEARGEARRIRISGKRFAGGKARPVYRMNLPVDPSNSGETPGAITVSDVRASLGMQGTPKKQKAAKVKIRHYRGAH